MIIHSLELKNFRNHVNFSAEFDSRCMFFSGRNGAGKTNILEAIYFLTYGKSFRTHVMTNMINHEAKESIITANYVDNSGIHHTILAEIGKKKRFLWMIKRYDRFRPSSDISSAWIFCNKIIC